MPQLAPLAGWYAVAAPGNNSKYIGQFLGGVVDYSAFKSPVSLGWMVCGTAA